jgi:hypothetical protein
MANATDRATKTQGKRNSVVAIAQSDRKMSAAKTHPKRKRDRRESATQISRYAQK